MKKINLKLTVLLLVLFTSIGQMWAVDYYLDISQFTNWTPEQDGNYSLWDGSENIHSTNVATNLYKFSTSKTPETLYFKRKDGGSNEFSVTRSSTYNVYKVTDWNSGSCANYNVSTVTATNEVYYDNSTSNFSGNFYFVIGHNEPSTYSKVYPMTNLSGTNYYHASVGDNWTDATYYAVVVSSTTLNNTNTNWGISSLNSKGNNGNTNAYTGKYDFGGSNHVYITTASGDNQNMSISYKDAGIGYFNKTQTLHLMFSNNGGSTYSDLTTTASAWHGTIKADRIYLNDDYETVESHTGASAETLSSSAYAKTALIGKNYVLTESGTATGYTFAGWGNTSGATPDGKSSKTISVSAANNIYAFFKAIQSTITLKKNDGTETSVTQTATYNETAASRSGSLPTRSGYGFDGYYTAASGGTKVIDKDGNWIRNVSGFTDSNGKWTCTSAQTLHAHWLANGYYLVGEFTGWEATLPKFSGSPLTSSVDIDKSVYASADYITKFKIRKVNESTASGSNETWYGKNNTELGKGNTTASSLSSSEGDIKLQVYYDGEYVFTLNTSGPNITVAVPVIDQLQIYSSSPSGDAAIGNHSWDGLMENNEVSKEIALRASTTYQFKGVYDSEFYSKTSGSITRNSRSISGLTKTGSEGNMSITTDVAGNYTFTLNTSTNTMTVTYPTKYTVTTGRYPTAAASAPTISPTPTDGYLAQGTSVTFTKQSANTGYTWKEWNTGSTGGGSKLGEGNTYTTTLSGNLAAYAIYTENDYNVSVVSSDATYGGTVASSSVTGHKDTKVTLPTATPRTGYYFKNWTVTSGTATIDNATSNNAAQVYNMTDDCTVQANFVSIWALVGSMNSWNANTNPLGNYSTVSSKVYGYVDVSLTANTQYSFKLKNVSNSNMYKPTSSNTEITYENKATAQGMNNTAGGDPNQTIMTAAGGTYRFTWNATDHAVTVTYPTSHKITIGVNNALVGSVSAVDNSSNPITDGKYVANNASVTFTAAAPSTGYTFIGWYSDASCETAYVAGANVTINVGARTLTLSSITGDKTVYAKYSPNTYTVTFDVTENGGTCPTPSKTVTYDAAYGTLPVATRGEDTFIGWYTTPSGEGSHVTAETIVSTAGNHTLYARYETTYEIDIQFKCGDDVLYPQTRVEASASSLSPTITAPEILGYAFNGWTETTTSYVTFADDGEATTTITTSGAATIVANYRVVPTVYFKNNLGWESVYVTFDSYFDNSKQDAPGNNGKPYYKMTQIESSDIFYCEIPSTYTTSNYTNWKNIIAFDNTGFNYSTAEADPNHHGNYQAFNGGEFIGRGDFDPNATMYIPFDGDTETRNGGTFFKTGCWIQYNSNYSGYKVRVNSKVSGSGGTETVAELRTSMAGSTEFTGTVNLTSANYTYGVMLYKDYKKNTNDIWYTNVNDAANTITSATTSLPWAFIPCTDSWQRCRVKTEALGDYTFTVSFATGKPMVDIEYPVSVGDWKLIYKDADTWSNDAEHPSRVIKAKADAEDIVSFFVSKETGANASVELHKCTAIDGGTGAETWEKQGSDLDISDITETGIYNFKVTQNGSKVASAAYDGRYNGNFYIRTDASDGGWSNYKTSGTNIMTYSEYAEENHDYTHYYMRFASAGTNIKFVIANDYNECISDTLINDTYTGEWIAVYGNVRFMWDRRTNKISRAYISGSSNVSDRFLVLEGSTKMFDANGNALTGGHQIYGLEENEMNFIDDQNWIYEATIKAKPGANALLTAKYNNKIQYFGGSGPTETDSVLLLGGSDANQYKIRVVYDFKTNRLIKAFIPDGDITTTLAIEADMMIIRDHQSDAQQVTFDGGKLTDVKTVYGALMFNKYTVNDKERTGGHGQASLTRYERDLFYISFPFDVKLSEVFGFGTYGQHWIIEYYDGKSRAKNGFWADSDPNWKFVLPSQRNSFTMKAFEGYLLALDLDEMTESSPVWNNNVENVYIYFPSDGYVSNIAATNRLITIDQNGYESTINRSTPDGDRRIKDSYWHCIGVPSFANYNRDLTVTNGGETIDWSDSDGVIDWSTPSLPYLYEWNSDNNTLRVTTSATFNFKATWSYLVQYAGASIYWSQVNATPSAIVAREQTPPTNAEFRIELQQAGEKADQTFVRLTTEENVTTGFDFNYDLSKEFNKNQANIYTIVSTMLDGDLSLTESAGNTLPMSEQTTIVPVGVKIAKDGDYTFSIPDGTNGIGVTLIDNETGIRTSLSALDYTINLTAGKYDQRFTLEISPLSQVATDIEAISDEGLMVNGARKLLIDNILYIVKDDVMFDAQGNRVK